MTAKSTARARKRAERKRLFQLEVTLTSGPIDEDFAEKNPVISRTLEIRSDQTLEVLHEAIFAAFDRDDEHLYEFHLGGGQPMDPKARRYVEPMAMDSPFLDGEPASDVTRTTLGSLDLQVGDAFAYWFDFGDDWWHEIQVLAIEEKVPRGRLPKVTGRVGESPPQYPDGDEEE